MKKIFLALFMIIPIMGSTIQPTHAQEITTYEAVVFQDSVNSEQYNYLLRKEFLNAVFDNKFTVIKYSHLKLPNGKYYSKKEYLKYLFAAESGGFKVAVQNLADNGKETTDLLLVKGKVDETGTVIPAEEPVPTEFKVISIK